LVDARTALGKPAVVGEGCSLRHMALLQGAVVKTCAHPVYDIVLWFCASPRRTQQVALVWHSSVGAFWIETTQHGSPWVFEQQPVVAASNAATLVSFAELFFFFSFFLFLLFFFFLL